jgi:hypothetical protein
MELQDYYVILGVPRTATARDILHAYRELAKRCHPDRVGPQGTATFQDIVEAYAVLSDPERWRHYTESLSQFVDMPAAAPPVGSARPEPLIPTQRRFRLYSQPEPLVPEPMSLFSDFGTIRPSSDALSDHLLQNFADGTDGEVVPLPCIRWWRKGMHCRRGGHDRGGKHEDKDGQVMDRGISAAGSSWQSMPGIR